MTRTVSVTEPFEVAGYRVPAGWRAVAGIYTTMHQEGVFTQPERFEPERFLPGREEHRRRPNSYVPHGGGPAEGHRCAGEGLISAVMMTAATLLLRDGYSSEVVAGQDLRLDRGVFPLPVSGLRVRYRGPERQTG